MEYSASLLVVDGQIRHVAVVRYVYADDAYVWPHVKEDVGARASHMRLPKAHRDVFQRLLAGYSGVCNVNYKVVDEGEGGEGGDEDDRAQSLRIFEVNARVGSDLAVHARRELTKGFFEVAAAVFLLWFCEDLVVVFTAVFVQALDALDATSEATPTARPPAATPLAMIDLGEFLGNSPAADGPTLEIYLPNMEGGDPARRPAALVCPGGGYTRLEISEGPPAAAWLASLGLVAAVLRYRLMPTHAWPAPLGDLHAALAALRSEKARTRWGVDGEQIVLLGFSAGAHLAAHAIGAGVSALVLVYPPLTDADGIATTAAAREHGRDGASPESCDDADADAEERSTSCAPRRDLGAISAFPPVYLVGSTNDRICPPENNADKIAEEFRDLGVSCTCAPISRPDRAVISPRDLPALVRGSWNSRMLSPRHAWWRRVQVPAPASRRAWLWRVWKVDDAVRRVAEDPARQLCCGGLLIRGSSQVCGGPPRGGA